MQDYRPHAFSFQFLCADLLENRILISALSFLDANQTPSACKQSFPAFELAFTLSPLSEYQLYLIQLECIHLQLY